MELPSSDDEALEAPAEPVPVYDSSSDEEVPIGIRFDIPMPLHVRSINKARSDTALKMFSYMVPDRM